MEPQSHWQRIYSTRAADALSWYQPHAARSLDLIRKVSTRGVTTRVIDIGGGASTLVDDLLVNGMTHVTVLDISQAALQVAQQRLGPQARRVTWIEADITNAQLGEAAYDVWH